jgi:hypothetical protein
MQTIDINERKNLILESETAMARQLALHVIEKPVPRVWMIFIPIFFVFYFWKLKQFESGLKEFADNYIIPRRRTLEAVFDSEVSGRPFNVDQLVDLMGDLPENARPCCTEWLSILAGHYRLLLGAGGDSYPALVRSVYRTKSNYLLLCRQLGKTENAFDTSLLPTIEGDSTALHEVTETMAEGLNSLRSREAEEIFSR